MEIVTQPLRDNVVKISLGGRMDAMGTQSIDLKFAAQTALPKGRFVVDLSGVDFLASIGIRTLLMNAKAVKNRGGALVIAGATEGVVKVLEMSGVDTLIPMYPDVDTALSALTAP